MFIVFYLTMSLIVLIFFVSFNKQKRKFLILENLLRVQKQKNFGFRPGRYTLEFNWFLSIGFKL